MAFEVAVYTDVLAAEALDGVDGFNFQAASAGISGVDQQRIRESLLHRVVPSWLLDHDELSHPPTCAYIVQDGRSYLVRGKSTGTTNSGRPGNQLTQAIVTSDFDDFVPYRPAQLYGALEWRLEKAPNSELEPWVTPLEIRPAFEVPALQELVRNDPWAAEVLPCYLTMIDQALAAEPTKLILLHNDLDLVMQWIALGTLFIDAETCKTVHFRALVDDPWRVDAAIVGVSPDFGVGGLDPANVLDLTQRGTPAVAVSETARTRAAWFLEHGADDALNAIEIALRWAPSLGAELASDAARLVALPDAEYGGTAAWRTAMTVVQQLANAGLSEDLALYAEELCEAAVGYGPATEDEFQLAGNAIRRAHDLGVDEVAAGIAVPTLEALARVPAAVAGLSLQLSGAQLPISWESADAAEAAGTILGDVLASAPATALADVFAAGWVLGCPVPGANLLQAITSLAAQWLHAPALGVDRWQYWLAGRSVLEATGWQALQAFRARDQKASIELLRGDWDFLELLADPALNGWLNAGALGRTPIEEREDRIVASEVPTDAWRIALASSALPGNSRLWACWIGRYGLSDDIAAEIRSSIERAYQASPKSAANTLAADWYPIMQSLGVSADPELARFSAGYLRARAVLRNAREDLKADPGARLDGCLPYVSSSAPLLLTDIGWLLVNSANVEEVAKLLTASSPWGLAAVRALILSLVLSGHELNAIDYALFAYGHHPDEEVAAVAEGMLAELVDSRPSLVDRALGKPELRYDLEKYLRRRRQGTKRRHGGLLGRGEES
jgi:hypothetical protein